MCSFIMFEFQLHSWSWYTLHSIIVLNPSGFYLKQADYYVNDTPVWTNDFGGLWIGINNYTSTEFLMDPQGIMQINTMGSDQIVTDEILLYEDVSWWVFNEMTWPESSLVDSPMCCKHIAVTNILLQTIVWLVWRNDCWIEGHFVRT